MKTLDRIQARSLMRTQVLKLSPNMPIARAHELFEDHKISGAPVVDSSGRVLGVLSASDITRADHVKESSTHAQSRKLVMRGGDDEGDDDLAEEDLLSIEDYGSFVLVAAWRSGRPIALAHTLVERSQSPRSLLPPSAMAVNASTDAVRRPNEVTHRAWP